MDIQPELSIIIINYNSLEFTIGAIDSILENGEALSYEIIVVDNNSKDFDEKRLPSSPSGIRVIINRENTGFARANNIGISRASGDFILLLNTDTKIIKNALQDSLQVLKQNQHIGVVGARLLNPDGTYQQSAFPFPSMREQVFHILRLGKFSSTNIFGYKKYRLLGNAKRPLPVDWVSGAFILFKKSDLKSFPQQKLHDDYFMYVEDIHWCYYFQKRLNKQIVYLPEAEVIHYEGKSLSVQKSEKRLKFYFPNLHVFLKSERGWIYAKLFFVLLLIRYSFTIELPRNKKYIITFLKILMNLGMEENILTKRDYQ